jgi:phosphate transport system protein
MAALVESALIDSAGLLGRPDLDEMERLIAQARLIEEKRLAIEMGCLGLIASRRPLDGELHTLVAIIEIAWELERVGDNVQGVSRANCLTVDHHLRKSLVDIRRLASAVQSAVNMALEAFIQQDVELASAAGVQGSGATAMYHHIYKDLLESVKSRPRSANQAIYLSRAARSLGRAATRVSEISRWVEFSVVGLTSEAQSPVSLQLVVPDST